MALAEIGASSRLVAVKRDVQVEEAVSPDLDEIDLAAEREGLALKNNGVRFQKPKGFIRRNGQSNNACSTAKAVRTTFWQRRFVSIG